MPDYFSSTERGELSRVESHILEPVWGEVHVTGQDVVHIHTIIGGEVRISDKATAIIAPEAVVMGDVVCAGRAVIFGEVVGKLLSTDQARVLIHPKAITATETAWAIYDFDPANPGFSYKRAPLPPAPPTFWQWLLRGVLP